MKLNWKQENEKTWNGSHESLRFQITITFEKEYGMYFIQDFNNNCYKNLTIAKRAAGRMAYKYYAYNHY